MSEDKQEQSEVEQSAPEPGITETPEVDTEAADENPESISPEAVIEQLEADLQAARDAELRAQADAVNVQRRAQTEVEKARKFALERFVSELLPVVDNLERALEAGGDSEAAKPIIEGVELTLKSFIDALSKSGVEAVDPTGEPFDPQTAQAMTMVENPDVEPNTVTAVMQKGYTLNGRLLRPAMVIVSKASA